MGDWVPSCAICGVIFRPEDCHISPTRDDAAPPALPGTENDGCPAAEPGTTSPAAAPDPKYTYDRYLISEADLLWLSDNNALGVWPDSSGTCKSVV